MLFGNFVRPYTMQSPLPAGVEVNLVAAGWIFTAEPTDDRGWMVRASKGKTSLTARATHLGEAFFKVEYEAIERESIPMSPP